MIRQYGPTVSRSRLTATPRGAMPCGVLPVGTICRPRGRNAAPVIIEGWEPREITRRDPRTGRHALKRMRGGHIAWVRCLASGRRSRMSDAWLLDSDD